MTNLWTPTYLVPWYGQKKVWTYFLHFDLPTYSENLDKFGICTLIMAFRQNHMSNFRPKPVCQSPLLALWRGWVLGTKSKCLSLSFFLLTEVQRIISEELIPKNITINYHPGILGGVLESHVKCDGVSIYRINIYWPIYSISGKKFCT